LKRILLVFALVCLAAQNAASQQQVQPVAGVLTLNLVPGVSSFKVILSANVTSVSFVNPTPGTTATVIFTENSTGGYTVAFGGNITNACSVATGANATTMCQFTYDSSSNTWIGAAAGGGIPSVLSSVIDAANPAYGVAGNGTPGAGIECTDMSWAASGNTVTSQGQCTFVNAAYPAGDIGKDFAGMTGCLIGSSSTSIFVSTFAAGTTITGVTSAHVITVSNNAGAAPVTANQGCIVYGKNQDTALSAADSAAQVAPVCPRVILPAGIIMMKTAHFITQPTACANFPPIPGQDTAGFGFRLSGQGKGVTRLFPMPGFSAASCIGSSAGDSCLGGQNNLYLDHLSWDGVGQVNFNFGSNTILHAGQNTRVEQFGCVNYSSSVTSGLAGVIFDSASGTIYNELESSTLESCGGSPQLGVRGGALLLVHNSNVNDGYGTAGQIVVNGSVNPSAIYSAGGFAYCGSGSSAGAEVELLSAGSYYAGPGDGFRNCGASGLTEGIYVDATSFLYLGSGSLVNGNNATNGEGIHNLGTVVIHGDDIALAGSGTSAAINNLAGGKVIDYGRWRLIAGSTGVTSAATGIWTGPATLQGSCSGTATSSSTLGLYGLGQQAALTCTSTTVSLGQTMTTSGTLEGIIVTATHAGVNASSGVVTVLKNGSATTITCTIGTGTSCADFAHATAYALGDVISVQFTTQTSEVLAGVVGSVVKL
jgi:hypothetical protein